jgi:hypothetical protein
MNPEDQKAPEEQWRQPSVSTTQAPYQAVSPVETPSEEQAPLIDDTATNQLETTAASDSVAVNDITDDTALIRWQSTEYLHQELPAFRYVMLGILTVVLMLIAYFVIKSISFTILLPVMAATLVMYVRRPPTSNDYTVSRKGIHINDKLYTYDQFRSFGIADYQGHHSVVLVPRKRFQLGQTLYFPDEVGETLVDMLAERLPMKTVAPDAIDKLLARLHL